MSPLADLPQSSSTSISCDPGLIFDSPTGPPTFEDKFEERQYLKHRLALAFRVFARHGHCEGIAGHLTLRDPVLDGHFWVNPFGECEDKSYLLFTNSGLGLHFSLVRPEDLILVNHEGRVVDGGRNRILNYSAFAIHAAIHSARPDVLCAAHSHSTFGRAFCATGRLLDPITQDSCVFFKDHALYP